MAAHFDKTVLSLRSRAKVDLLRTPLVPAFFAEPTALIEEISKLSGPVPADEEAPQADAGQTEGPLPTLIVTADANFQKSLRQFCVRLPEIQFVAEADNMPDALLLGAELKPHLAFVDLYIPGLDIWHSAPLIGEFSRMTQVILFASDDAFEVLSTHLAETAAGFVSKRRYGQDLPREIKRLLSCSGSSQAPKSA